MTRRIRKKSVIRRIRKKSDKYEEYLNEIKNGEYYYCTLPPGNKTEFDKIDALILKKRLPFDFATYPSGWRIYRIRRDKVEGCPKNTSKESAVPYGFPCPTGYYHMVSQNSLSNVHGDWKPTINRRNRVRKKEVIQNNLRIRR